MPQIKTYKTSAEAVIYAKNKYGLDINKTTKDISGQTFGKLFVIRHIGRGLDKKNYVLAQCTGSFCDKDYVVAATVSLRSGNTTSCGCARFKVEEITSKLKVVLSPYPQQPQQIIGGL